MSKYHHLSDAEILDSIQTKPLLVRAFRLDIETRFLIIEIPLTSKYHTEPGVAKLVQAFQSASINARHYRIADTWFLYIFFDQWISTDEAAELLLQWISSVGFATAKTEIILHTSGAALPIPLQHGFVWFNDLLQPLVRRDELSIEDALALFLTDLAKYALNSAELFDCLKHQMNCAPPTQRALDQTNSNSPVEIGPLVSPAESRKPDQPVRLAKDIRPIRKKAETSQKSIQLSLAGTKLTTSQVSSLDDSRGPPTPFT